MLVGKVYFGQFITNVQANCKNLNKYLLANAVEFKCIAYLQPSFYLLKEAE